VYSKNPEKIKKAEEAFHVGQSLSEPQVHWREWWARIPLADLYVGDGFESGRKRYLLLFMQGKSIADVKTLLPPS